MQDSNLKNQEDLISKIDEDRKWLLKNLDGGRWSDLRTELAALERELSRTILRLKAYIDDNQNL